MAEQHGFSFALISDHFHPWTDRQGQSPFVWSVIGGIAPATRRLEGPRTADLAGRVADGMIGTDPSADAIRRFQRAGGAGKPRYAELTVCWARSESAARRSAREVWPTEGPRRSYRVTRSGLPSRGPDPGPRRPGYAVISQSGGGHRSCSPSRAGGFAR